ncbi:DUF1735 domain-containing protein [Sphingobacterium multivorum]|nr:DUF1735 domain-containing protein [Sphingobacterium multivorum]QQT31740.1 DUF1735 domain-containing protein [Sphingobacterium multivorum]
MKKILKYISLALVITTLFSSCLKDDAIIGPDAPGAISNIIEFKNPGFIQSGTTSKLPLYLLSFDMNPTGQLVLEVNYAGSNTAPNDINVKVKLDNSLIDEYNDDQDDEFVALPTSQYSISSFDVVIKKGERVGKFVVDLKPSMFTFDKSYALGFSIESASVGNISGNFGKIVVGISGKNFFDGTYAYTTSANTALVPNANKTVTLVTIGGNKCQLKPGLLGTYSNVVNYTVDQATNNITVEMTTLLPIATKPTSKYDPATKTLTVNWTSNGGARTFEEKFVYTGPRD